MNRAVATLLAILLFSFSACSSTDDAPPERRGGYGGGERARVGGAPMMGEGGGDTLPSPDWWRDPQTASAVNLTKDQYASLETISREQSTEVETLRRESSAAARDFRLLLDAEAPTRDDILTAGQRLRTARDQVLDRNIRIVAAQRVVLTKAQWDALQSQLRSRDDRRGNRDRGGYGRGGGRRGGRGGMGGMGGGMGGGIRP